MRESLTWRLRKIFVLYVCVWPWLTPNSWINVNEVFPMTLEQCDPKLNCGGRTLRRDKATWGFENYPPPPPSRWKGGPGTFPRKICKIYRCKLWIWGNYYNLKIDLNLIVYCGSNGSLNLVSERNNSWTYGLWNNNNRNKQGVCNKNRKMQLLRGVKNAYDKTGPKEIFTCLTKIKPHWRNLSSSPINSPKVDSRKKSKGGNRWYSLAGINKLYK